MTGRGGYLTRVELLRFRGSLDNARDDGAFFVVISTKRSAWRNPLRRSSNYPPPLLFYPHKLQRLCFLVHSFNFLQSLFFFLTLAIPYYQHLSEGAIHALIFSPTHHTRSLSLYPLFLISFLFTYRCYNMLYLVNY